jgi:hypothetical protein
MRIRIAALLAIAVVLSSALTVTAQTAKDDPAAKVKLAADRLKSANNLKQIGLAFHNHNDAFGALPRDITDKDGKPLLSWRVAILPFLDQNELHEQFNLDQPWDSKNNKKLLEMMPKVYTAPRGTFEKGHTFYQAFAGAGTLMSGKPTKINDVTDGLSNTFMAVEAGEAVPWTKPADVAFDPAKPLPKLGGIFDGDHNTLFGDGSVRFLKKGIKEANLKKFITIAGAESTTEKDLEP